MNNTAQKVLRLNVKRKWYELLKSGLKNIEYRQNKDYWRKRITNDIEEVHFYCGYPPRGTPPLVRKVVGVLKTPRTIEIHLLDPISEREIYV